MEIFDNNFTRRRYSKQSSTLLLKIMNADLPTPVTCKSGGFEKQAQKNLGIRTSNLETSKICVK